MRSILSVFLALAAVAGAQDEVRLEALSARVDSSSGVSIFEVEIRTDLPPDTAIDLNVHFEGRPIPDLAQAGYLDPGASTMRLQVGPLLKTLLPGPYEILLLVDPTEQNPDREEFWSRHTSTIERRASIRLGSEAAERAAREETRRELAKWVDRIDALQARTLAGGEEWLAKKEFFDEAGRFQAQEFLAWADPVAADLTELKAAYEQVGETVYMPYFASQYFDQLPDLWLFGYISLINYTIHPILVKEGVPVPERFEPLRLPDLPPKDEAVVKLGASMRKLRRSLGEGPRPPAISTYLPAPEDLPPGLEIAAIPEAWRSRLATNPTVLDPLPAPELRRLVPFLAEAPMVPREGVSAIVFCLTETDPAQGREPGRVLVAVVRLPDLPQLLFESPDPGDPDSAEASDRSTLLAEETMVTIEPGPGESSHEALRRMQEWYVQRFGCRLIQEASVREGD